MGITNELHLVAVIRGEKYEIEIQYRKEDPNCIVVVRIDTISYEITMFYPFGVSLFRGFLSIRQVKTQLIQPRRSISMALPEEVAELGSTLRVLLVV